MSVGRKRFAGVLAAATVLTLGVTPLASAAMSQHNPWDDDGYGECGYHYCPGYPYGHGYGKGDGGHHATPYGARADHDPRGRDGDWGDDGPDDDWSYWDAADSGCWRDWC